MKARLILVLLAMTGLTPATLAGQSVSHSANGTVTRKLDDPRDIARRLPLIPAARASEIALGRVPGTVLEMEIETNDGIRTWQVDIQPETGRPVRIWLNANTGGFLRMVNR